MADIQLSDWPLKEDLSDTVLDFLIKYPRLPKERVIIYWDNFILTNYRLYYKNQDETIHLIPHYKVREYIIRGKNTLILKLRDKTVIELNGPIPKFEVLKRTYGLKDWRRLSKKANELLTKTNAELGRPVREKPKKVESGIEVPPRINMSSSNGIYCPHCGFKITVENARFCPNCGVDLV
ncbi:MAG: zinc-ribbon domain-containing protein [Candidatus Odinarchaeia archaeon]